MRNTTNTVTVFVVITVNKILYYSLGYSFVLFVLFIILFLCFFSVKFCNSKNKTFQFL